MQISYLPIQAWLKGCGWKNSVPWLSFWFLGWKKIEKYGALFVMRKTCMLFTMFVAWFGSFFRGMLTAKPWYWYQGIPLCFGSGIVLRLAMTDVEVLAHWDANFHVVRPLIRDHRGDQPLWSFWTELFCLLNWTVVYPWGWYIYHEMVDFYGINYIVYGKYTVLIECFEHNH